MTTLTPLQKKVMDFIFATIEEHGWQSTTAAIIGQASGIMSQKMGYDAAKALIHEMLDRVRPN